MTSLRRLLPTLFFTLLLTPLVFAQDDTEEGDEPQKDPIDVAMETAIDKDPSTAGQVSAISDANTAWDRRMNSVYKKLKAAMEEDEWEALVAAQREWVKFRDLQAESIKATYGKMDGTMWIPVSADAEMELTKQRAQFLQSFLDTIEER